MRPVLLLILCLLGSAGSGLAQRAPSLARVEVALWPEYDRADSVLVIYRFRLRAGTPLPTTVALAVPVDVLEPHAVAWKNPQGGLMLAEFRRVVDGDRALILVTTQGLEGQLEFYSRLRHEGAKRNFSFEWPGGIEAGELAFEIQHPSGSSSFEMSPPAEGRGVGQDGLTYEMVELGAIGPAAKPTIELRYERDSDALATNALPPTTSVPASDTASENETTSWPYYAFGGVSVVAGLALLWWTSRKPKSPERPAAKKVDAKFCPNCGTKLLPRGDYCNECGTRVRG